MTSTTPLSYRIDSNIKNEAESILSDLGLSPTSAIQMFYKQIIINKGLPFEAKLSNYSKPISIGSLSEEELIELLDNSFSEFEKGRKFTSDEAKLILKKKLGF